MLVYHTLLRDRRIWQALQHSPREALQWSTTSNTCDGLLQSGARTRSQLPVGQGAERVRVDQHAARLVEGADHVFAQRVVHARLAANG